MRNKDITIFDNYYDCEREKDVREYLFDEYADENEWKSPNDIADEDVQEEIDREDSDDWDNLCVELRKMFSKNVYLLTGTCGRWDGPAMGGRFIHSLNDMLRCIEHLDYIRIYDRNGHFYIHGSHHDGCDDYELKRLTNKGYELANNNYFAHDRKLHETIMHNNLYSALPKYAQEVYGGNQ